MGASAFLKSVDFTAFAINAKTIALGKYLYQSGRAMGYYDMPPEDVRDWTDGFSLLNKWISFRYGYIFDICI